MSDEGASHLISVPSRITRTLGQYWAKKSQPRFILSFGKAWKLRYGCIRPDVEQHGTLQEQLRKGAAIVVAAGRDRKLDYPTTRSGSRKCDIGL